MNICELFCWQWRMEGLMKGRLDPEVTSPSVPSLVSVEAMIGCEYHTKL